MPRIVYIKHSNAEGTVSGYTVLEVSTDEGDFEYTSETSIFNKLEEGEENPPPLDETPLPDTSGPVMSTSGRYLRYNNTPWFWVADSAWKLTNSNLSKEDITVYLEDRKSKGVRVIQGPTIFTQTSTPLLYNKDTQTLIPENWQYIDHAVSEAGRLGMILCVVLSWGPDGDYLFPTLEEHIKVTSLVVKRYSNQAHIVWIPLGEYHKIAYEPAGIVDGKMTWTKVTRALNSDEKIRISTIIDTIHANKHPASLITVHPDGWKSPALDWQSNIKVNFNMLQPSDSVPQTITGMLQERSYTPNKPSITAEAGYEGQQDNDLYESWAQRKYAWYTAFSGGSGYTYGHGNVWDFEATWKDHLNSEGASQILGIFKSYMDTVHSETNTTAQTRIVDPSTPGDNYIAAIRNTAINNNLKAYTATGRNFSVKTSSFMAGTIKAKWFNPRTGQYLPEFTVARADSVLFNPPGTAGPENDWVLEINVVI